MKQNKTVAAKVISNNELIFTMDEIIFLRKVIGGSHHLDLLPFFNTSCVFNGKIKKDQFGGIHENLYAKLVEFLGE